MAKKSPKPVTKSSAKSSKTKAKPNAKTSAKPAVKSAAKTTAKTTAKPASKAIAKAASPKKETFPDKKAAAKTETSRPALMTARGKVKAEEAAPAEVAKVIPVKSKVVAPRVAPSETSHEFDSSGDQLIAMAKDEMSKINKTGDADKSAEKSSKFKPIKIERGNLSDEKAKWQELNKRHGKEKAATYKMSESFESLKPIQHKVLGWGFVLTNDNNRLEVLFENGIKMLISNYKAN